MDPRRWPNLLPLNFAAPRYGRRGCLSSNIRRAETCILQFIEIEAKDVPKLLVVDDEQSICWGVTRIGESLGYQVVAASSAEDGLDRAVSFRPDIIVLDVR